MIGPREFITLLGGAAASSASWPLAARAQQQDRPQQVAILFGGFSESDPEPRARIKAFKEQLQELGWTDGGNIRVQARMGRGRPDQVRAYAAELVGMMPDVLAANSGPALAALLRETRTIPIVFASSSTRLAVASFQASPIQEVMPPASLVLIRP
jgi:putative ABC transport system substrate-binding protein